MSGPSMSHHRVSPQTSMFSKTETALETATGMGSSPRVVLIVLLSLAALLLMQTVGGDGLPDVTITSHSGMISGTYELNVTVTGDLQTGEVYYGVDDDDPSTMMTDLGEGDFQADIDTTPLTDGPHTIYVKAINSTGQETITSIQVDIDMNSPHVVITTEGGVASGGFLVTAIVEDAYLDETAIYCVIDDDLEASRGYVLTHVDDHFEITIDTTAFPDGDHFIRIWAFDIWGSSNKSQGIGMYVDNTAPIIEFLSEGGVQSGTYLLRTTVTDTQLDGLNVTVAIGDSVPLGMDEGASERTFEVDTTQFDNGDLVLTVVAPDLLGHTATESITITVDNRPDLSVSDVEWSEAKIKNGQTVEVNVTVRNVGHVAASGFKVAIMEDDVVLASFDVTQPLAVDETTVVTIEWTAEVAGNRVLCILVDPDDTVEEYDEDDNKWSVDHQLEVEADKEKEEDSPGPGAVLAVSVLVAVTVGLVRWRRRS